MGIRPAGFGKGGVAMLILGVLARVLRRAGRARGASSGSTISVLVVRRTNPGWRGRSAGALVGRAAPGYLPSGLQPEEQGTDGLRCKVK
jgi:hypothetical protein